MRLSVNGTQNEEIKMKIVNLCVHECNCPFERQILGRIRQSKKIDVIAVLQTETLC
jgi:hypothetical protein